MSKTRKASTMLQLTQIEIVDMYSGLTTRTIRLDTTNPLDIFKHYGTKLDDNINTTLANVLAYAAHIYSSLEWYKTDGGLRTTVRYGSFIIWLYQ